MTGGPQGKSGVRARSFQKCVHCVGNRAAIALAMQIGEQAQRLRNRLKFCLNIFFMPASFRAATVRERYPAKRMQSIELMPKTQKRAIGDSEQRTLQSGEDGEFIIGPLNGR